MDLCSIYLFILKLPGRGRIMCVRVREERRSSIKVVAIHTGILPFLYCKSGDVIHLLVKTVLSCAIM